MNYIIHSTQTIQMLMVDVNQSLKDGYELVGGVAYNSTREKYIQAMIKKN